MLSNAVLVWNTVRIADIVKRLEVSSGQAVTRDEHPAQAISTAFRSSAERSYGHRFVANSDSIYAHHVREDEAPSAT